VGERQFSGSPHGEWGIFFSDGQAPCPRISISWVNIHASEVNAAVLSRLYRSLVVGWGLGVIMMLDGDRVKKGVPGPSSLGAKWFLKGVNLPSFSV